MTEEWQPLSARESGKPAALREGVPDGLGRPLRAWIERVAVLLPASVVERLAVLLDIELDQLWFSESPSERLANVSPNNKLVELADGVLYRLSKLTRGHRVTSQDKRKATRSLQQLLDDARSVYKVKDDGTGIERRVDPVASGLVVQAVSAAKARTDAGSAAKQLREASEAVRALHPNASLAYSLAIKAVESAVHAVIEPNNKKATLGTMLGILDANPAAFEVEIAGKDGGKGPIAPVTGIMRMLWDGQTSRHGSKQPAREETREEAEMAAQLASLLVLWFSTGMVRRK